MTDDLPLPILTAVAAIAITTVVIYLLFIGGKSKAALDPVEFKALPLIKKESISHDVCRFTFALPNGPTGKLGLPVGQHITLKFTETLSDGSTKNHQRSYTPTTGDDTPGTVTFVIKVYKANVHPKFPEGGKMSQHLDSLKIGDTMLMRGPKGEFIIILFEGTYDMCKHMIYIHNIPMSWNHISMERAATNISSMYCIVLSFFHS